jgi:hypothetical protein
MLPPRTYSRIGEAVVEQTEPFRRTEPLDPASRPLPPYDCPTGECASDKVCTEVQLGDTIDPFGLEHVERNACNRCPTSNPEPVTRVIPEGWVRGEREEITHYMDSQGNRWQPDSWFTAPQFHGDPGIGHRTPGNQTYRLEFALGGGRGWQCRYVGGVLDDTSLDLGTYDYAPAPSKLRAVGNRMTGGMVEDLHNDMDVSPHFANPNYAPGLTETY